MIHKYKYTLISLAAAAFFIFGNIAVMSSILKIREAQLLTEHGRVKVESPVKAWEATEDDTAGEGSEQKEVYTLTTEQIKDVIQQRDESLVVTHDPVNGQISMEEAIMASENWLKQMGIVDKVAGFNVYTRLSTTVSVSNNVATTQLEPYYSFWLVRYDSQFMTAYLDINAVTGKVWSADITLYKSLPEGTPYEKLRIFTELSGVPLEKASTIGTNMNMSFQKQESSQIMMRDVNSSLCAILWYEQPRLIFELDVSN